MSLRVLTKPCHVVIGRVGIDAAMARDINRIAMLDERVTLTGHVEAAAL